MKCCASQKYVYKTQGTHQESEKKMCRKKTTYNENNKQITSSNSFWPLPQSFIIYKHKQNHPQPEPMRWKRTRAQETERDWARGLKRKNNNSTSSRAKIRQQYGNLFTALCHRHSLFPLQSRSAHTHDHHNILYIYNFNLIYYSLKIVLALQFVFRFFAAIFFSSPRFAESIACVES